MKSSRLPNTTKHRVLRHLAAFDVFWRPWEKTIGRLHGLLVRHRAEALAAKWEKEYNGQAVVAHGPFAGLIYPQFRAAGSALLPKLAGRYESELSALFTQVISRQPPLVIDIGGAEGYYAVGLARAIPHAHVISFDPDKEAEKLCQAMATANDVATRVELRGACEPADLLALNLPPTTFILCDCEGYEAKLFSPAVARHLQTCELIIECHDYAVPQVSRQLISVFTPTHIITVVSGEDDDARASTSRQDYPRFAHEPTDVRKLLASEQRPVAQYWLHLLPRELGEVSCLKEADERSSHASRTP